MEGGELSSTPELVHNHRAQSGESRETEKSPSVFALSASLSSFYFPQPLSAFLGQSVPTLAQICLALEFLLFI